MKHVALTTQQAHPGRAFARTFLEVIVALPTVLLVLAGLLDLLAQDTFAHYLPDAWVAWLAGAAVFTAALAGLVARVLAFPPVDAWLKRLPWLPLASDPNLPREPVPDVGAE